MTKKVLISLEDIDFIIDKWFHCEGEMKFHFKAWFDAQPEVSEVVYTASSARAKGHKTFKQVLDDNYCGII